MEMRAGDAARGADRADALARLDMLPGRHSDAVHVLVGRGETVAVIDDDGAAGIEEIALGQRHGAAGGSDDSRAPPPPHTATPIPPPRPPLTPALPPLTPRHPPTA